jgi:hypothetical protein
MRETFAEALRARREMAKITNRTPTKQEMRADDS